MNKDLTQTLLKNLFTYDEKTGNFIRNKSNRNVRAGEVAGYTNPTGYVKIHIFNKIYAAHRLVFTYLYDAIPDGEVDHINGIKSDNRLSNLRIVKRQGNQENTRRARASNECGYLGVSFHKRVGKWQSQIQIAGKKKHIGYFDNPKSAHEAYLIEKRKSHLACTI